MAEQSASMLPASTANLACFEVKGTLYAIDITCVREIVQMTEVTPLPNAPALIEGIVDLRGAVIPVIDLAKVIGRGQAIGGRGARIVVLELDGLALGLQVDSVTDVIEIEASRLEDVPGLAAQAGCESVRSVVRRPGEGPITVLAVEGLIEHVHRSATSAPPETEPRATAAGGGA